MMKPCPPDTQDSAIRHKVLLQICQSLLSAVVRTLYRILTKMPWAHPTLGWVHLGWALVGKWSRASTLVFPSLHQDSHKDPLSL